MKSYFLPLASLLLLTSSIFAGRVRADVLSASGVSGGLVVQVGCDDSLSPAALRPSDAYLVQVLDTSESRVAGLRASLSQGEDGPISVRVFDGRNLPYADGLVNLLILRNGFELVAAEISRVLAPEGLVMIAPGVSKSIPALDRERIQIDGKSWSKLVKPKPEEIDEWTHYLHDPSGNPVAKDSAVGPPRHLRWTDGPLWARNHGWTPSVTALVSSGGRLFTISDETLSGMDATVPSKWFVVARDAYNGIVLWRRPIPSWGSAAFSGTPDAGIRLSNTAFAVGRFTMPPHAAKRFVAIDETIYVTLGPNAPVTALDAHTGNVKHVYQGTERTDEILVEGGRLILSLNPLDVASRRRGSPNEPPLPAPGKQICVVDIETGQMQWKQGPLNGIRATIMQDPGGRLELCLGDDKIFALTDPDVVCLDVETGEILWRRAKPALAESAVKKLGYSGYFEFSLTTMSHADGVLLIAQPEPNTHHTYHTVPGTLHALDAENGSTIWTHPYGGWGHQTSPEVFVIDDLVWTHVKADAAFSSSWGGGYKVLETGKVDYRIQALDLKTGKLVKELSTRDVFNVGHHHRCYRNRITEDYLLSSRRGVEFVDLATGENTQNHWVRSGCLVGNLPCNGLLYVTPHPCSCYVEAKLTGYNALAADSSSAPRDIPKRLTTGPAYDWAAETRPIKVFADDPAWWPTYRHDRQRTGATPNSVGANLQVAWETCLGGKPSAMTVAQDSVFVSAVDSHTVYALGAGDGTRRWQETVDARVDSPPTWHAGMVLFGSRAGCVYCLRAADGEVVWKFHAAPNRRMISAMGQLESPWPVPGSVLVQDGKCWFAAGRSSYLDGGMHVFALDPTTGDVLYEKTIYSPDPKTHKMTPEVDSRRMAGLLNDIPGSDGAGVYLRGATIGPKFSEPAPHLHATAGFLDSSWFNRVHWRFGSVQTTGLMVVRGEVACGVEVYSKGKLHAADALFSPGSNAYSLWCCPVKKSATETSLSRNRQKLPKPYWVVQPGIRVSAMVHADDMLVVGGSPDVVDPADPHAAWEGRKGGRLAIHDTSDGRVVDQMTLSGIPVWDGMAVAQGSLYVATENGAVVCLRGDESR